MSPLAAVSPANTGKQPAKGKGKLPKIQKAERHAIGKAKGKKGKEKKSVEQQEALIAFEEADSRDDVPDGEDRSPVEPGQSPKEVVAEPEAEKVQEAPQQSRPEDAPTDQPLAPAPGAPSPLIEEVTEVVPAKHVPTPPVPAQRDALRPVSLTATIDSGITDLSVIDEREEENSGSSSTSTGLVLHPAHTAEVEVETPDALPLPASNDAIKQELAVEPPPPAVVSVETSVEPLPAEQEVPPTGSTQITAVPAVPVRQVSSSWLSKALGTGTVPVTSLPNSASNIAALRKSFAAPSQRPIAPVDFATLRKSLAPVGGLKRKSEGGVSDVMEENENRPPEKVAKVEIVGAPTVKHIAEAPAQSSAMLTASTHAPASSVSIPFASGPSAEPDAPSSLQKPRPDTRKVSKALDELRERNAKGLAKQQSAPKSTSTGSGFLRGIGNFGRSLGLGSSRTAEDEALRMEEERRAEPEAQKEIQRLPQPLEAVGRPMTPSALLPVARPVETEREEPVEEIEVDELHEEIGIQPVRPPSPDATRQMQPERPVTPPQIERVVVASTTPAGTPPRAVPFPSEAPAIHGRSEKHQYPSPAKAPKPAVQPVFEEDVTIDDAQQQDHSEKALVTLAMASSDKDESSYIEQEEMEEKEEVEVSYVPAKQATEISVSHPGSWRSDTEVLIKNQPYLPSSSSSSSLAPSQPLAMSTSSQATSNSLLSHASAIAGKTLGLKPSTGPVKSLQLAAAAAKKVSNFSAEAS